MKKQRLVIFALLAMLLFTNTVASANSNYLNITMNGQKLSVREVPVMKNGNAIKSDSPSFVYIDRTLVSARLVAESYGAKVDWDQATKTATINQNGTEVKLTINNDVARINGKNIQLDKHSIPRLVNFGGNSAVTMVPINFLAESLGYETGWDQETRTVHLLGKKGNSGVGQEEKPVEVKPEPVKKNQVTGVEIIEKNGSPALRINGSKKVKRNIIKLSNPERIVIDLMDSELVGSDKVEYDHDVGIVGKVRTAQYNPSKDYPNEEKVVRIVLDIKSGITDPKIDIQDSENNVVMVPEKSFWDNINYDTGTSILTIKNKVTSSYDINYYKDQRKMDIIIPSANVELSQGKKTILDAFVSQLEINTGGAETKVTLHFRRPVQYDIRSGDMAEDIVIGFKRDKDVKKSDRLIVIDPGHGGRDPGASRGGVSEKDLMLTISLKLRDKLVSLGYNVEMTRSTDKTLVLKNRAKFANDISADLFVSMHANSSSSVSPSGIEVYYTPKNDNPMKGEQQTQLAKFIQEELIKATGANNRGAKTARFLVTRETDMPSVLVEAGFISNTAERNKMLDPNYQDKLVNAIVRGIERYFEIY